jgi:hypothetical protein
MQVLSMERADVRGKFWIFSLSDLCTFTPEGHPPCCSDELLVALRYSVVSVLVSCVDSDRLEPDRLLKVRNLLQTIIIIVIYCQYCLSHGETKVL